MNLLTLNMSDAQAKHIFKLLSVHFEIASVLVVLVFAYLNFLKLFKVKQIIHGW